ncbi:DUF1697 domain-containing protein [Paenibacillus filicis]|uniref:DUF1697 domain-containing protein n=1 Tax=Paenibacillus gyeongsangnamensis TaxID=3388067 RepID=A0ABT4QFV2_9BACL|nr:DUF1697 domain-containing protein [Paenibacillus filicis]MCZ8515731.1 DUF1697 domain-containing protein [Paenibacillus filicis]
MPVIALLRGINVSGKNMIKMDRLKALFEALGYREVRTYIQSGNVVFDTDAPASAVADAVERRIREELSYNVKVLVRTSRELEEIAARNPFGAADASEGEPPYVTFLFGEPSPEALAKLEASRRGDDEVRVLGREAYVLCRNGYGKTPLSNSFLEKKLDVYATTRNWKTIHALIEMSRS